MRRFFYAISDDINTDKDTPYSRLDALSIGASIELTDSIVHHWCRVLRANVGDQGILFDGFGGEYQVQLQTISKKHATATLLSHLADDRSSSVMTQIGLVMSRGERMDYAIQKSTELGVTAIQLLSSHHGEVNLKPAQVEKKVGALATSGDCCLRAMWTQSSAPCHSTFIDWGLAEQSIYSFFEFSVGCQPYCRCAQPRSLLSSATTLSRFADAAQCTFRRTT